MSFLVTMPLAAFLACRSQKKTEETLAVSILISILILIVSGLMSTFQTGCLVIILLNLLALAGCIEVFIRDRKSFRFSVCTAGVAAYLVLGVLMFTASYGRYLQAADEFTYWGRLSKMYYTSSNFNDIGDMFIRYLEIGAIWDFFSTRMWSHYSVGIMTFGHAMMILSFLMPVFCDFSGNWKKDGRKWLTVLFMIWMFPMLGAGVFHGYVTLYADMLLGAAMIYTLMMFLRREETGEHFYQIGLLFGLAAVVLMKQAGMILGAVLILVIAGTTLATHPKQNRKQWLISMIEIVIAYVMAAFIANGIPALLGGGGAYTGLASVLFHRWPLILIALAAVTFWLWLFLRSGSRFVLTIPIVAGYTAAILLYMIKSSSLTLHQNSLVLFAVLKTVMCAGASHMGDWLQLSDYAVVNLIMVLGLVAELLLHHQTERRRLLMGICRVSVYAAATCVALNILYTGEDYTGVTFLLTAVFVIGEVLIVGGYLRRRMAIPAEKGGLCVSLSFWMFYFLMIGLVMYLLFYYSGIAVAYGLPQEGWSTQNARSLWRYLFSYMGPLIFLLGYILLKKKEENYIGSFNPFWAVMLLIFLDANLVLGVSQLYDKPQKTDFKGIEGITFQEGDVLTFLDANSDNEPNAMVDFEYQIYPGNYDRTTISTNWYEDDVLYGTRMTPQEVSAMLLGDGCTYVYLRNVDLEKDFAEYYTPIFEDPAEISYDRLYHVEQGKDGLVSLVYVPRKVNNE